MSELAFKKAPRKYQLDALNAMTSAFVKKANIKRGLVVLPTGAGKTYVAAYFNTQLVKQLGMKIIWAAHRDELIKQAYQAHLELDPTATYTEWTARAKDATGTYVFVSIQSSKGLFDALKSLGSNYILIVDEAHHFASEDDGYSNMYAKLEKLLFHHGIIKFSYGLTATATRLDGRPLGYEKIIYQIPFIEGVREGFLARPTYYEMRTKQHIKLGILSKHTKKDYTDADLSQLDNETRNKKIAEEYVKHSVVMMKSDGTVELDENSNPLPGWGKTLLFAINIKHCHNLAEHIRKLKPDVELRVITGASSNQERIEFKKWLAEGDKNTPKIAINCLVFTEGFDEPTINTIFLTRPTKSESLWMQMVGRGARVIKQEDGTVVKDTFNLVSVMDEIGRYGALVKEWTISILDDPDTIERKKRETQKKEVQDKRLLINKILSDNNVKQFDINDAELVDVKAILIASNKSSVPIGIPLNPKRINCIRNLRDYMTNCFIEKKMTDGTKTVEIDMDAFRNSYSHCVKDNELDRDTWRQISLSYYFHFVRRQKVIKNTITGKNEPTWKIVSVVH